jgi:hypothetical protein
MILRRIRELGVWMVVGEAYEMNGESSEPDLAAARYKAGIDPYLFWII